MHTCLGVGTTKHDVVLRSTTLTTNPTMDSPTEAAAAGDLSPHTFSQVVFIDIPHSYPPSTHITCCYTLNAAFQSNSRDWVGIFKVGWSSTKDYHTFVWVELHNDVDGQEAITRQALFKDYYLPKDEIEFYQFCYVDSTGQVRGASTPFCFRNAVGQSLESSAEDDLLVVTTQEQVDQSLREKTRLQKELDAMRLENETLKSTLLMEQRETASFKVEIEKSQAAQTELVKGMDQIKVENENLKSKLQAQLQENNHLKEEVQLAKQRELQYDTTEQSQSLNSLRKKEERYDQAVMKINQLKEEREKLKEKDFAQDKEITDLKAKLRERERELLKTKDAIQLLQVDVQSSKKEKERLTAELQKLQGVAQSIDTVTRENKELVRRLSNQETVQNSSENDLTVQCQTLGRQLQETQEKLTNEREETRNTKRQVEILKDELGRVKEKLAKMVISYEQEQQRNSKYEMQCREMNGMIADKNINIEDLDQQLALVTREKDELTKENLELKDQIEGLRRVFTSHDAASADSAYMQPNVTSPAGDTSASNDQQAPDQSDNIYETIDSIEGLQGEESLVCRHCQESFPGITRDELEQHEQSHRVCPFCTMICDHMEQSVFEDHVYGHEL
ncbi:calcium-binding and coiled-coil domain-containing protein 2 isoform X2 [Melanotaenia boesemani]|uniref:calcium-binding and coiled-coil domain-containing protein 2 isoform X2 n=1 Tax=Melanotaenia boesemani TaxID=1250792 RepID=UPI001C055C7C|nr:calcium-binding and coiled-coil domain-containing protein 2 isoform X2 [Melanotaenia boesemani]